MGSAFTDVDAVTAVMRLEGRSVRPAEARRILDGYAGHGFVTVNDGRYEVTDLAIQKFGLHEMKTPAKAGAQSNAGTVAERSIAPDSKSGGEGPEKFAPVGSNPTGSAPINVLTHVPTVVDDIE